MKTLLRTCWAVALLGMLGGSTQLWAAEEETSSDPQTLVGTVTAKGDKWIEVQAEGEQESKRYTPRWSGGLPQDGGGLDKEMLAAIQELKVGSRIQMEWNYEERLRVLKIEVLEASGEEPESPDADPS
jgi:hypothetical protein